MSKNHYSLKILSLLICMTVLSVVIPKAGPVSSEEKISSSLQPFTTSGLESLIEKNGKKLSLDTATGEFVYTDTVSNQSIYSNPVNRADDTIATAYHKLNMDSQLMIRFANDKRVILDQNSAVGSARKDGMKAYKLDNGFRIEYEFVSEKIMIPLEVTVDETGLCVRVILDQIEETGTNSLIDFSLLPYLGSAGMTDEGYLLIPDGSGALVRFTSEKEIVAGGLYYKKDIYGRDPAYDIRAIEHVSQKIMLPVFGVSTQKGGMLGIITQGDAISALEIFSEGVQSENTVVHPYVTVRPIDTVTIHRGEWNESTVQLISTVKAGGFDYEVRYDALAADECDYTAMARNAAEHYIRVFAQPDERSSKDSPVMMVKLLMAVRKPGSILGIPVNTPYPVTTASQVNEINAMLHEEISGPVGMILNGAFKGGIYDKIPLKAKHEPRIGKVSSITVPEKDMLFFSADLISIYRSGNGIRYRADASRSISGGFNQSYDYMKSTFQKNEKGVIWTTLRPARIVEVYEKFANSFNKSGITSLEDTGVSGLSSDNHRTFGKKQSGSDREIVKLVHVEAVKALRGKTKDYSVIFAPAYLLGYVTQTTNVPAASSNWTGYSECVPFYQMVVSRFVPLYGEPVNRIQKRDEYLLRSAEYGMLPQIELTGSETSVLRDTAARDLYNGYFADWAGEIGEWDTKYSEAWDVIRSAYLTGHEITGQYTARSDFSDGSVFELDYSKMKITVTRGDEG